MATRELKVPEAILQYVQEVRRECDTTPIGILIALEDLARLCVNQQHEIDRLKAFAFGVR
jgi:hypothetical protein